MSLNGAVYDIQDFIIAGKSYIVVGINAIIRVYMIEKENNTLSKISEADSQIITYKIRVLKERADHPRNEKVKIMVADIMKSVTVYNFLRYTNDDGQRLLLESRDPNGLWCVEMAKVPFKRDLMSQSNLDDEV